MKPEQVLHEQTTLMGYLRGTHYPVFAGALITQVYGIDSVVTTHEQMTGLGRAFCLSEVETLASADTYMVTEQMVPLVEVAAVDLPIEAELHAHHLPSLAGFCYFERPLQVFNDEHPSLKNETYGAVSAMSWDTVDRADIESRSSTVSNMIGSWVEKDEWDKLEGGLIVSFYVQVRDAQFVNAFTKEELRDADVTKLVQSLGDLVIVHQVMVPLGFPIERFVSMPDKGQWFPDYMARHALAVWSLMQQTIVTTEPVKMTPKRREGWQRKRVPGRITVVTLRRRSAAPVHHEGLAPTYTHRWTVRGHWRKQPCGPGRSERRLVYIHPFVKGPDDAPLLERRVVSKLSR